MLHSLMPTRARRRLGALPGTTSFGCLSWPACAQGGTLCPEPDSLGASLNPCCHVARPAGICPDDDPQTYPGLDANGNTPEDAACLADPSCDQNKRLLQLLGDEQTGTGAGSLPCGQPGNPCGPDGQSTTAFIVLAIAFGALVIWSAAK
jgi:hypothetical protein